MEERPISIRCNREQETKRLNLGYRGGVNKGFLVIETISLSQAFSYSTRIPLPLALLSFLYLWMFIEASDLQSHSYYMNSVGISLIM